MHESGAFHPILSVCNIPSHKTPGQVLIALGWQRETSLAFSFIPSLRSGACRFSWIIHFVVYKFVPSLDSSRITSSQQHTPSQHMPFRQGVFNSVPSSDSRWITSSQQYTSDQSTPSIKLSTYICGIFCLDYPYNISKSARDTAFAVLTFILTSYSPEASLRGNSVARQLLRPQSLHVYLQPSNSY